MSGAQIIWGYEASNARSENRVAVMTDFSSVVNPHMAICGDTGNGKTHTVRHAITEVLRTSNQVLFHIFDVHDDIKISDKDSEVIFSEVSPFGLNPLSINPDPHTGGVRKCIQSFIEMLGKSPSHGRSLGNKQQDVLRNLMLDVFEQAGYYPDDPDSWVSQPMSAPMNLIPGRTYLEVPFAEKELAKNKAKACGIDIKFQGDNVTCWHVDEYRDDITRWPVKRWGKVNPTLADLCQYATRRRAMSFTGMGQKEIEKLEGVNRRARSLTNALQKFERSRNNNGFDSQAIEEERETLEKSKDAALKAYEDYITNIEHGNAVEALLKYDWRIQT